MGGKKGADLPSKTQYMFVWFFSVSGQLLLTLTLYLCLCSSYCTRSTGVEAAGRLVSPVQPSPAGARPPGLRPHRHLASCIHSFILWISWVLSSFSSSCRSSLPCVPCLIFGTGWVFPRILSVLFCFMPFVGLLGFLILQCLSVAMVISCHIVLGDVLLLILLITTMLPKTMADVESDDND